MCVCARPVRGCNLVERPYCIGAVGAIPCRRRELQFVPSVPAHAELGVRASARRCEVDGDARTGSCQVSADEIDWRRGGRIGAVGVCSLRDLVPLRAAVEQLGRGQLQLFRRSNLAEKDVH